VAIIGIEIVVALVIGVVAARLWYRHWRAKKIAAARRVEHPNSHYSSAGVRNQEDRERWGDITLPSCIHSIKKKYTACFSWWTRTASARCPPRTGCSWTT
jgi:hypothetical protein